MNTGSLNESYGSTIIDQLLKLGVDTFFLSPGFRSTPLTLALAENQQANTHIHFDERGSAFRALGFAKATGKPACVVVTSGTALGNLMPAVMEAHASDTPLLLLTSDRPQELRDTQANQTCDQLKIFGDYVRAFFDLSTANETLPTRYLATTLAEAVARTRFPEGGPVQINCPFREPFFSLAEKGIASQLEQTKVEAPTLHLSDEALDTWAEKLSSIEKGAILLGPHPKLDGAIVKKLGDKLGWPVLGDITASVRPLPFYHHILESQPEIEADLLLHIGGPIVSKAVHTWIKGSGIKEVVHLSTSPKRNDPFHRVTTRLIGDPEHFCSKVLDRIALSPSDWLGEWEYLSSLIGKAIDKESLSELSLPLLLQDKKISLFLGNSMPIRNADMFLFPEEGRKIYANRGLSGIDGNIATCCGLALEHPLVAVLGDQTALHDLNSLAMVSSCPHPITFIIVNNFGGGIFSFVAAGNKGQHLDQYFAAEHTLKFAHAAQLFGIPYSCISSMDEMHSALETHQHQVIEINTSRTAHLEMHQALSRKIQKICKVHA